MELLVVVLVSALMGNDLHARLKHLLRKKSAMEELDWFRGEAFWPNSHQIRSNSQQETKKN